MLRTTNEGHAPSTHPSGESSAASGAVGTRPNPEQCLLDHQDSRCLDVQTPAWSRRLCQRRKLVVKDPPQPCQPAFLQLTFFCLCGFRIARRVPHAINTGGPHTNHHARFSVAGPSTHPRPEGNKTPLQDEGQPVNQI